MSEVLKSLIGSIPATAILYFVANYMLKKIEKTLDRSEDHNIRIALLERENEILKEQIKNK